jgi:hypothetical protein
VLYCIKCGTELPTEASFCFKCGTELKNIEDDHELFEPHTEKIDEMDSKRSKDELGDFWECDICNLKFDDEKDAWKHEAYCSKKMEPDKYWTCDYCMSEFNIELDAIGHEKSCSAANLKVLTPTTIVGGVIGFLLLMIILAALSSDNSDNTQDNQNTYQRTCCEINLKVEHKDLNYSELSYVIYFDDQEGPSGTLSYGDSEWHWLCSNCNGRHTIEVYWGDGDDCQQDVHLTNSDKYYACTNR